MLEIYKEALGVSARGAAAGRRVTLYLCRRVTLYVLRTGGFRDEPERVWLMNAEVTAGLSIVNSLRGGRLRNRLFATIVLQCTVDNARSLRFYRREL